MKKLFLSIPVVLCLFSCSDKAETIHNLNDLKGCYEGTSIAENNTIKTEMSFNGEDLFIKFSPTVDEVNHPFLQLKYSKWSKNKKDKDSLVFKPTSVFAFMGYNAIGSEIFIEGFKENKSLPNVKLFKITEDKFQIKYNLQKAIKEIQKKNQDFYLPTLSDTSYKVTRINNPPNWWYFNPMTNFPIQQENDFTNIETIIENKLNARSAFNLTTRQNFQRYFELASYKKGNSDKDKFLESMTSNGSFFQGDFNDDNLQDVACYYSEYGKRIHFFIYLNNGIDFDLAYSADLSKDRSKKVFTKSKLKGKDVIQVNYVNSYMTNYLYYNRLKGTFDVYLTD